jgi:protein translocase SecG subunit
MKNAVTIIQIVTSILIIISVMLQQRDSGLSGVFGGGSTFYQTRRGAEKMLVYVTTFSALIFLAASIWEIFAK